MIIEESSFPQGLYRKYLKPVVNKESLVLSPNNLDEK